ncbi:NTP transferase domain-containing protein [Gordonia jinghuaiqii]|uniref:NTP transferase domain-containing protein n=1 Tax=Gordonia jinghuaiqii TaxID=2758710 RepID=A0A7D7QM78_9ACTN|nr:sugar phosphate nucleotidyltransferase [Gordonia jinghuaiqii]MCR5976528.1 NTP transferase domain-containing protein [Gordonia jinghuaiqii]QMS99725.1 NTP transferase domain-containing protein [Gordonia jinghuaiqii]
MRHSDVLAIVQAGGRGSRMEVLTDRRAKPALPFAGNYQLIDFPLSNLHHSHIDDVWLCVQYEAEMLSELVAAGRPWDLDRTSGGLRIVMPEETDAPKTEDGFATGNADLLYRIRDRIARHAPAEVIVMSADHVYEFDYRDALDTHRSRGAECTIVTTTCPLEEATQHATVAARRDGTVREFRYKPERATTRTIATEIFIYDPAVLIEGLEQLAQETSADSPADDTGLGDFGEHLVPWFVDRGKTVMHAMPGYWIDAGRPETYLQAHQDLIAGALDVFRPDRPILTRQPQRPAARIESGAVVEDSLVSSGAHVLGTVRRSVLGPGVVVDKGATVVDSVIFADTVVGEGASVTWSVLDERVRVGARATIGGHPRTRPVPTDKITLLGSDTQILKGAKVALGDRVECGRRIR